MDLFLIVLEVVAPVFLPGSVGFLWVRTSHVYRMEFATRLSMSLAVPALIFTALMETTVDPAALTALTLPAMLAHATLSAIFWGLRHVAVAGRDLHRSGRMNWSLDGAGSGGLRHSGLAATPVAVTCCMLAENCGADADAVAGLVIA